jgi:hypothetical protein
MYTNPPGLPLLLPPKTRPTTKYLYQTSIHLCLLFNVSQVICPLDHNFMGQVTHYVLYQPPFLVGPLCPIAKKKIFLFHLLILCFII